MVQGLVAKAWFEVPSYGWRAVNSEGEAECNLKIQARVAWMAEKVPAARMFLNSSALLNHH